MVHSLSLAVSSGLARRDAHVLALHALGKSLHDRAWLLAHDTDAWPSPQVRQRFERLVAQRLDAVPVAYLTGQKEFFGLTLAVDQRVLDPRDDTETLVEWALDRAHIALAAAPSAALLDLGTGSGAVALALAHHLEHHLAHQLGARVWATDACELALQVAQTNALQLRLCIEWAQGSWFDALNDTAPRFHVIASNPPYIAEGDAHLLALRHEPRVALTSGADGLDAIRHIVAHAPKHLADGGWLLLEHGHDQGVRVQALMQARGFTQVQSRADLAGVARCSGGQWSEIMSHHRST